MKKATITLIFIISFLISLCFGFYEQTKDMQYFFNIERTENSVKFFVKNENVSVDEELIKFKELSEKYNASFIKSDLYNDNDKQINHKSGVFAKGYFESLNLDLISGNLPKTDEQFLATYNTGDPNQSGILKDLFVDSYFIIGPLENYYKTQNPSILGSYVFKVDEKYKDDILNELSTFFQTKKEELTFGYGSEHVGSNAVVFLIILIVIIVAIFCLNIAFYPISCLKEIGVMKLNGFLNFDIFLGLNKSLFIIPLIFYIVSSFVLQFFWIKQGDFQYFLKLSFLQFV